ncbi:5-methylthioadenosine/S-adenosylhomocysteine deaminase [Caloramator mitchellensis]|uniref:5-methylthioadenosine/S-adenosylhomocysteine deaminase n=1 Tax=Caloramator mitchellensis TaxID=908809 RepID=A0A0R3K261_CALMK|nr:amidohydrolase [Caloramator mitchellensis]KRQ87492.1 5-methylthioadenosine/S-adenosylhomocysteine deaminase [Caloramator mitchellensis]
MSKILIENVKIITMEKQDEIISRGYVLIEDSLINLVEEGEYTGEREGLEIIDGKGCVALPGLINCHTHIPMTLLRGYGEGLPLMRWLNEKIWPFEMKLNSEDIYAGALLGMIEMVKSGTTSFVDMYFMEDAIAKACKNANLRGFLGSPMIGDFWKQQIDESIALFGKYKDDELVNVLIAPHSPYTLSMEALKQAGEVARKYNIPIHIHIAETMDEVKIISDKYNTTPAKVCEEAGIFENNRTIAAHCVHFNDEDIDMVSKYDFTAVYNPQSNMKLASGIAPVVKMINKGVNVAIGTDGASSNNNLNLIEEMQTASYLQKLSNNDATALSAYETLKLATVNAAKAVGMEDRLGKIKKGYLADIILIDFGKPHMNPPTDVYSNIVFSAQGGDVRTVIVNGKVVMKDYILLSLDEKEIIERANRVFVDVINR